MVIVIGLIGLHANMLVLYALCVTERIKKHVVNVLFINQMSIDLFSCVCLVVIYSCKLANLYLSGSVGYWLCIFISSEAFIYIGLLASSFNLAAIAVERCIKIAYPFWHKKHVSSSIGYAAVIFVWLAAILSAWAPTIPTTIVEGGECFALARWDRPTASFAFGVEFFVGNFAIVLLIFVLCYGQILITVRMQARVLAVHHSNNPLGLSSKQLNNRIRLNIVKLMIIVSGLYVACLGPIFFYNLLLTLAFQLDFQSDAYYGILFVAFFNSCLNPFIYAFKYNTVEQFLVRLVPCRHQTKPQISSVLGINLSN
jgi:7 transmembrane receptor (rhodopsin family)